MSGELVRYRHDQQGLSKVSEARRSMDEALAKLRGITPVVIKEKRELPHEIIPCASGPVAGNVLDLPRVCAVHDRLYMSRYVQAADGFFHYGQGIRITSRSSQQYDPNNLEPGNVPSLHLEDETCPWCEAFGHGAIFCTGCNTEVCYGKTIAGSIFHCRKSCGHSGRLTSLPRTMRGIRPQFRSASTTFIAG